MEVLPKEIWSHVLGFLDPESLLVCRLVRKDWNSLISSSTALKLRLPFVSFNLLRDMENRLAKPLPKFLEVMETHDKDREFPFCKFKFNFWDWNNGGYTPLGLNQEDAEYTAEGVQIFRKLYGKFVKSLVIKGDSKHDATQRKICNWINSLIDSSPNVQHLNLTNDKIETFNLIKPLEKLEQLTISVAYHNLSLLRALFSYSACPKLKKVELQFGNRNQDVVREVLQKLTEFRSVSIKLTLICDDIFVCMSAVDFFRALRSVPIKAEEVTVICRDGRAEVKQELSEWLASLSSSLEKLVLHLYRRPDPDPEMKIPKLEKLKHLGIYFPERYERACPFSSLDPAGFPSLTDVVLDSLPASTLECLFQGTFFPQVTRLTVTSIHEFPLSKVFQNLEELTVSEAKQPEDLTFILTHMTQLRRLELGTVTDLAAELAPDEDSWLPSSLLGEASVLPNFEKMTNLTSLKVWNDYGIAGVDKGWEILRILAYLSSAKKIRPLVSLVFQWADLEKSEQPVEFPLCLQQLRECHQQVQLFNRAGRMPWSPIGRFDGP